MISHFKFVEKTTLGIVFKRMQQNIQVSLILFSLVFLNLGLGKYLIIDVEDKSEVVPGKENKIGDVPAGPLVEDDKGLDWRGPFHQDDRQKNVMQPRNGIKRNNKGLPCIFRCHVTKTTRVNKMGNRNLNDVLDTQGPLPPA